jgi:6-phospho-beta-glucosidase
MKLAVLGGGGVRSPFLAKSIIYGAERIGLKNVVFMDNNEEKLNSFGLLAKNIANRMNPNIDFKLTSDAKEAVKGADFIITTLRVGEDAGRVIDERVALDLGVLGQETTGAGGFSMALRSIPALRDYCELIKKYSKKDALIFNFTNPSGLVTQALRTEGYDNVYGICDAPSGFKIQLEQMYNVKSEDLSFTCFGLNHLSWFKDIKLHGKDISVEIANDDKLYKNTEMHIFDKDLVALSNNYLLNEYLYFYYYREKAVDSIIFYRPDSR